MTSNPQTVEAEGNPTILVSNTPSVKPKIPETSSDPSSNIISMVPVDKKDSRAVTDINEADFNKRLLSIVSLSSLQAKFYN